MRPKDFDVYQLIESLAGTCNTIQEHLPEGMEEEDLTQEDHNQIDLEIFECPQCNWWYRFGEDEADSEGDYPGYCISCAGED